MSQSLIHAHQLTLFEQIKLPGGKIIIPGVIEAKSNFLEHPELVAQRIARYAEIDGRAHEAAEALLKLYGSPNCDGR